MTWAWVDMSAFVVGFLVLITVPFLPKQRSANPRERLNITQKVRINRTTNQP